MHSRGYKGFLVLWIGYYESQAKSTTAHVPEQAKQYVFMGTVSSQQTHGMKCLFVTKKNHTCRFETTQGCEYDKTVIFSISILSLVSIKVQASQVEH